MIASERKLGPTHPHHQQSRIQPKQRRQPPTTTKNGIKNPIKPVKLFVIDPRKIKEKLEAVAAKKKEDEKAKTEEDEKLKPLTEKVVNVTATQTTTSNVAPASTTFSLTNGSSTLTNILPPLVTNFASNISNVSTSVTTPQTVTLGQDGSAVVGNGVTLQCINATGFVPALPLVVTNGVALLQQPLLQSSIPTGGIFLPGITAFPGVIGGGATLLGAPPSIQPKILPKPKKKKPKRRKRKLKPKPKQDEEGEDDSELAFLSKQTTTRNGRVSRPTILPKSPPAIAPASDKSEFPISSERNEEPDIKKPKHISENELNSTAKLVSLNLESPKSPINPILSTNTNDKVVSPTTTVSNSGFENDTAESTSVSVPQSQQLSFPIRASSNELEQIELTKKFKTDSHLSSFNQFQICLPRPSYANKVSSYIVSANGFNSNSAYSPPKNTTAGSNATQIRFSLPPTTMSHQIETPYLSSGKSAVLPNSSHKNSFSLYSETSTGASLVPNKENEEDSSGLYISSAPSIPPDKGVDVVPTSYSIPSSPPSQCQSPGLPDHVEQNSERHCQSPVDPMLLRSRSPFPPPVHAEISLPSVSLSNLTIPEESLCKGELFMDLGDGILENSSLVSRFCGDSVGALFSYSHSHENPSTTPDNNEQSNDNESAVVAEEDIDLEHEIECGNPPVSLSPPHVSAPVLLETTEDANDGEIFQTANYARKMLEQSQSSEVLPPCKMTSGNPDICPKTPQSNIIESDISMDSAETPEPKGQKRRSIWQFVKDQIKFCGITQACGEIFEVAEKLSRIARDQFIPIREEEIERLGNAAPIIHVDTPFFSHLLDLPFGTYIFKEDVNRKKRLPPPPPPLTSSELSFTCGVEDVEKFLPPDIDLISLPHLTNLDLT